MVKKTIDQKYIEITDDYKIKQLLYLLLDNFHFFCEKNGLKYSLYFGSLIGAVRHKAIIPWDDDIDIVMPRPDYDKLILSLKNEQNSCLQVYDPNTEKKYAYPFVKVGLKNTILVEKTVIDQYSRISLYIDVFPMDVVPSENDKQQSNQRLQKLRREHDFYYTKLKTSPTLWKKPFIIFRAIKKLFLYFRGGLTRINCATISEIDKYSYEESSIITYRNTSIRCSQKYEIDKQEFEHTHLTEFGPIICRIFDEYDVILRRIFGDYMTPPPKEKQISCHNYTLYIDKTDKKLIQCLNGYQK